MKRPADIKMEGRMPEPEELRAFYDSIATPREGDGWFGSTHHIDVGFSRVQFALGHIQAGMSILEVGCADGGVSQHAVKAVGEDGFATLLDISPAFVAKAEPFVSQRCPGVDVEYVTSDAMDFNTRRRYDVILAMEILEHVPDPRGLLGKLWGLLRKNTGKILITVPFEIEDQLGEHVHDFTTEDIMNIVGDSIGLHVTPRLEGNTIFAVVDKENPVPYVP